MVPAVLRCERRLLPCGADALGGRQLPALRTLVLRP
jgi:hypothetical protein